MAETDSACSKSSELLSDDQNSCKTRDVSVQTENFDNRRGTTQIALILDSYLQQNEINLGNNPTPEDVYKDRCKDYFVGFAILIIVLFSLGSFNASRRRGFKPVPPKPEGENIDFIEKINEIMREVDLLRRIRENYKFKGEAVESFHEILLD